MSPEEFMNEIEKAKEILRSKGCAWLLYFYVI